MGGIAVLIFSPLGVLFFRRRGAGGKKARGESTKHGR
jgi:hypothetical protein